MQYIFFTCFTFIFLIFHVFLLVISYLMVYFYAKFFSYFSNYLLHIYKIWCILSHVDRTAENFVLLYMNIYSLW